MDETTAAKALDEKDKTVTVKFDEPKKTEPEQPKAEPVTSLGLSEGAKAALADAEAAKPSMASMDGWKMIPLDNLPSRGIFYPMGTEIAIRAALVSEVRHFSSIDETDPLDTDDKLNVIMDKCLKMKMPDRQGSYRDLKEEDRLFLIFACRDLTFLNGENKLFINIRCGGTCLGDGTFTEKFELKNGNFEYYTISEELMNFFSPDDMCFILPFKNGYSVKLYVPSLGVTTFIKNFLRERQMKGDYFDRSFMRIAPFMFGDWRLLNADAYQRMQHETISWGIAELSAVLKATELIRFGIKTDITRQCNKCGAEVTAPLTFPGGIKSLFLISDSLTKLR